MSITPERLAELIEHASESVERHAFAEYQWIYRDTAAALRELQELREWMRKHAHHPADCMGFMAQLNDAGVMIPLPCTCGLRALLGNGALMKESRK